MPLEGRILNTEDFEYYESQGNEVLQEIGFDWDKYLSITTHTIKTNNIMNEKRREEIRREYLSKIRNREKIEEMTKHWIGNQKNIFNEKIKNRYDKNRQYVLNFISKDQKSLNEFNNSESLGDAMKTKKTILKNIISHQDNSTIQKTSMINHLIHPETGIIIDNNVMWTYEHTKKKNNIDDDIYLFIARDVMHLKKYGMNKTPIEIYTAIIGAGKTTEAFFIE